MKTRQGFVSNSSSSSFVIPKDELSYTQMQRIISHINESKMIEPSDEFGWCNNEGDAWDITITDDEIRGWTCMDNFDMHYFLQQIGVPDHIIEWSRG